MCFINSSNAAAVSAAQQAETKPASVYNDRQESLLKERAAALLTESYTETGTYQAGRHNLAAPRRFLMEELQKGSPAWCGRSAGELARWLEARRAKLHSLYGSALENFSKALQRMAAANEGQTEKAPTRAAAIEAAEHLLMSDKRRQELEFLQQKLKAIAPTPLVDDSHPTK